MRYADVPVGSENSIHWIRDRQRIRTYCWMFAIAFLFVRVLSDGFKSRRRLEAEILVLRHQLNVLQQRAPRRPLSREFVPFLTIPAYEQMLTGSFG